MGVPVEVPPDIIGQSGLYNVPTRFSAGRSVDDASMSLRLRLQDTIGNDIPDLEKYFRNKEVLVLYAGSEHGLQPATEPPTTDHQSSSLV
ncbi:hypothetical protein EHS25_000401 [Saitozyma podzolica]|uniref:Uncharacterized protein n=1 Tax=Saitozyma podzolica TaxID=1890683 RepID=A0A427YW03_9TREE|nr:hypothetical protein EHS25_000401 [Saitozyma podzolica]